METPIETPQSQKKEDVIVPKVELTQVELDDLKHKAEVSSQNFERAKKAETELKELREKNINVPSDNEPWSDEGKLLQTKISEVENELLTIKEERDLERLYSQYPLLREKASEFSEYRKAEHPRAKLESVAKLYLAEEGLLEPKRKGLENPTGGERAPMVTGMTAEEVEQLRKTNYKKYKEMLVNDQIKFS